MATVQRKSPYEILGVSKDISYSKLRIIYRKKIHEHLQNKISVTDFRLICRAYEILSDSTKRKLYDTRQEWVFELPIEKYIAQQLASESALIDDLTERLRNANLAELNAQDPITGHTTLYCAARVGNIEVVLFLIDQGAAPDLSQRGKPEDQAYNDDVKVVFIELKQSAYIRAAANELDWFLKNGLTVHQDAEYFSHLEILLHCASKKDFYGLVRWLVERCDANMDLVALNGNTPLHLAAYSGHIKIVEYLLNRGCDPAVKNRWGTTAEDEGYKYGNSITGLFKCMRERDMFGMARTGTMLWFDYYFNNDSKDLCDSNGVSLLYHACRYGQYAVVKWLLEHAKFRGHALVVELLLEHGADVDIEHDFGASVFEDEILKEVNRDAAVKT
ncbi:unnamed protein product [Rotaria socialis]|uniref:J domain-containing protein n=1 Tax=Rotaria socialis TaxID=392032 RepID=A0A821EDB2_9BILA|nr:unnamed protein product [Rotaria socialis]